MEYYTYYTNILKLKIYYLELQYVYNLFQTRGQSSEEYFKKYQYLVFASLQQVEETGQVAPDKMGVNS